MGKMSVHAALGIQGSEAAVDPDSDHAAQSVCYQYRRKTHGTERRVVVADAWSPRAVHAEAAGPQGGRSDRPVVLRAAVLGSSRVDIAIRIAEHCGGAAVIVMAAVPPADLMVGSDLVIQFHIEL